MPDYYYIDVDGRTVIEMSREEADTRDPERLFKNDPFENPFIELGENGRLVYTSPFDGKIVEY